MVRPNVSLGTVYYDLASFSGTEAVYYGGQRPEIAFGRDIRRGSWFTFFQTPMRLDSGHSTENATWKASRSAHHLLHMWATLTTPEVSVTSRARGRYRIAFTRNLMHQIFRRVQLKANDLTILDIRTTMRDNLSQHEIPTGKWECYNKMIGNQAGLVNWSDSLPSTDLQMPFIEMPWELSDDSSNAFPLCAMKMNELRVEVPDLQLDLSHLIRVQENQGTLDDPQWVDLKQKQVPWNDVIQVRGKKDSLPMPQLWAEYALITKEEMEYHESQPITYSVHQYQVHAVRGGADRFDFKFNHGIKGWWLNAVNLTAREYNNFSNYTTNPLDANQGDDPVRTISEYFEGNARFENMPASHFSQVMPYFHSRRVPLETGYHYNPRALNMSLEPLGCTNYGPLQSSMAVRLVGDNGDDDDESEEVPARQSKFQLQLHATNIFPCEIEAHSFRFPSYAAKKDA